jgi:hypothetical protein
MKNRSTTSANALVKAKRATLVIVALHVLAGRKASTPFGSAPTTSANEIQVTSGPFSYSTPLALFTHGMLVR